VPKPQRTPDPVEQARGVGKRQLADRYVEDALVKEAEGLAGLLESRNRVFLGLRQVFEELADLGDPHIARVALGVKEDEPPRPFGVSGRRLCSAEVDEGSLANPVEQTRGLRSGHARVGDGETGHLTPCHCGSGWDDECTVRQLLVGRKKAG